MSTLTKVFIVLLVIFSIAFTTMTVSMVAQQTNWRTLAERYREHANIADTNLRHQIAASAAELATAQEVVQSHLSKITEMEAQASKNTTALAEMEASLARSAAEKSSADAMNAALLAQLESTEKARGTFQSQRDELERRSVELERRNIDLNDRVNEQTARIAVLMEQKRQYEQQINTLRGGSRMSGLPSEDPASAAMQGVSPSSTALAGAINGTVVDVAGSVVTISVGAADGVRKDMVFVVHRNDQYVGDLQITMVDPDRAAGRPVGAAFSPQSGDQVIDAAGLGSPGVNWDSHKRSGIMAEIPGAGRAESNVYTILLIIATVVMIGATIYLAIRHQHLFGTLNPFSGRVRRLRRAMVVKFSYRA